MVLLVNPPFQRSIRSIAQTTVGPPMGLAYLASTLEAAGVEVEILDANALDLTPASTSAAVAARDPAVLGLTAATPTIDLCAEIATAARARGWRGPVVLGGPHPTALPEATLAAYPVFDLLVSGEAEPRVAAIVEVALGRRDPATVPGICWRDGGIRSSAGAVPHPDPDELPPPARHLLPLDRYACPDGRAAATVVANRGCPAPCTYCLVPRQFGARLRRRRVERVVEELEALVAEGIRWINFLDDTFTWDRAWVLDLCEELDRREVRVAWQCLTRVDRVDRELLRRMEHAGCARVEMGLEVGSARGRAALRKLVDEEQVVRAFRAAREVGLETLAFAMVNAPGETLDEVRATGRLLERARPDYLQLSYCTPYPGTPLYDEALREGRLRSHDWRDYRFLRRVVLDNGVLGEEEVVAAHRALERRFWLRPARLAHLLARLATRPEARGTTLAVAARAAGVLLGIGRA